MYILCRTFDGNFIIYSDWCFAILVIFERQNHYARNDDVRRAAPACDVMTVSVFFLFCDMVVLVSKDTHAVMDSPVESSMFENELDGKLAVNACMSAQRQSVWTSQARLDTCKLL